MCCAFRILIFLNIPANLLIFFSFPSSPWLLTLASSVMTRKTVLDIRQLCWKNRRFDGNARQNYFLIESYCASGYWEKVAGEFIRSRMEWRIASNAHWWGFPSPCPGTCVVIVDATIDSVNFPAHLEAKWACNYVYQFHRHFYRKLKCLQPFSASPLCRSSRGPS